MRAVLLGRLGPLNAVDFTLKRNGRHRNLRLAGQAVLDRFQRRIARRVAVPVRMGLDGHSDKIGIVEGRGAALESCVIELPGRRPELSEQAGERAPVLLKTGTPARRMEIVLVPEAMLLRRRNGVHRRCDVLKIVAVAEPRTRSGHSGCDGLSRSCSSAAVNVDRAPNLARRNAG